MPCVFPSLRRGRSGMRLSSRCISCTAGGRMAPTGCHEGAQGRSGSRQAQTLAPWPSSQYQSRPLAWLLAPSGHQGHAGLAVRQVQPKSVGGSDAWPIQHEALADFGVHRSIDPTGNPGTYRVDIGGLLLLTTTRWALKGLWTTRCSRLASRISHLGQRPPATRPVSMIRRRRPALLFPSPVRSPSLPCRRR